MMLKKPTKRAGRIRGSPFSAASGAGTLLQDELTLRKNMTKGFDYSQYISMQVVSAEEVTNDSGKAHDWVLPAEFKLALTGLNVHGILLLQVSQIKQKEAFDQNAEVVGKDGDATKVAIYDNGYNLGDAKPTANVHGGATSDSTVEVNLTLFDPRGKSGQEIYCFC
jgi:hypothetical protein